MTIQVRVNTCNSITDPIGDTKINFYPNPSSGEFTLSSGSEISISVVNELGQQIRILQLTSENNFITTVKGLSKGIYFLRSEVPRQFNKKIIIE
jgi:hypothetical protein